MNKLLTKKHNYRKKFDYRTLFLAVALLSGPIVKGEILSKAEATDSRSKTATEINQNSGKKTRQISGTVKDEYGEPVMGATVLISGTSIGTATDLNGKFTLNIPVSASSLKVSYIGYTTLETRLNAKTGNYNITINPDVQALQDVVVTGYQTISRERAAGSFSVVTPEELKGKMQDNIMDRLEGKVAGLTSTQNGLRIRGQATLKGETKVLYVVDGVPFENDITFINPAEIVNVTVLKDASAASIYGARSANGVVVITTRTGEAGTTRVNYNGSVKMTSLPSRKYMNRMSSEELVDFQTDLWSRYKDDGNFDDRKYYNPVYFALHQQREGVISEDELNNTLNFYRSQDRYAELEDEFLRKVAVKQQHNVSFSGGSEKYKYSLSANYTGDYGYNKNMGNNDRIGFNLRNQFNFFSWLKADIGIIGSSQNTLTDTGLNPYSLYTGGSASYITLRNPDGSPAQWYTNGKSQFEIDRLKSIGLKDETYIPLNEIKSSYSESKNRYLNINIGLNVKLWEGLTLDMRYQNESTNELSKTFQSKDNISVKKMINDASVRNTDGTFKHHVPFGGQVKEINKWGNSYTLRAQLNYQKIFNNKHDLKVLAGAERRAVKDRRNGVWKVGYDDSSLGFKYINELDLTNTIQKTESLDGTFRLDLPHPSFVDIENRYVSFYSNAAYSFDRRLSATASIRIDQSNLFGTDPKYQYRPLWSVGAQYIIFENKFPWLNRLAGRATYGINGNIAKQTGPFMIVKDELKPNYYTNEIYAVITSPPNAALRWEKTDVVNIGLDFNLLKNRLNGSIEFYNKKSTDLLGSKQCDPTYGWSNMLINYGDMYNRGIEMALQSTNIQTREFRWTSNFIFAYNKNKVTNVENEGTTAYSYYEKEQARTGYPMGALFSVRYAGLDEKGIPRAYDKDGNIVTNSTKLTKEDLVYSGLSIAPYNASLTNSFYYKGFELSFMFTYYGGHKMRDPRAGQFMDRYPALNYTSNMDKGYLNYWKNPGDEADFNMAPAFNYLGASNVGDFWKAADIHIRRADYIKLRDLTLTYNLPSSLLRKAFIRHASVNFQCQNLWTWCAAGDNLDSEVWKGTTLSPSRGNQAPRSYTIGLSLNF